MEHINHVTCLVCGSSRIKLFRKCKDYLVSGMTFPVYKCSDCGFGFTQHAPTPNLIGNFYRSEQYISHTNTRKGLTNRVYHRVREQMLSRKRRLIERAVPGSQEKKGKLLDIGCGTGHFLGYMQDQGWEVQGIEPSPEARAAATKRIGKPVEDVQGLSEPGNAGQDLITLWHALEHIHDPDGYLTRIHALLRENGILIIAAPNHESLDARIYKDRWAAYDVPRHLWHFTPSSIRKLVEPKGFRLLRKKRLPFDPFYIAIMSEEHTGKSFSFLFGMLSGGLSYLYGLFNVNRSSSVIYIFVKE